MATQLTERQKAIQDFRKLLRKYNGILVGDKGINKAYRDFLKRNKLELDQPTQQQIDYEKLMNTAMPLMESKKI